MSCPLNFAFAISLDWFRPFQHSQYSVGAIYLTVLNLPRDVRNKPENVMLVGILPGPTEPASLNGFIKPLVDELANFWIGKEVMVNGFESAKLVRCATCDLPAGRKLCGFLSYNAHQGCSRCSKSFVHGFSGFDRDNWSRRTGDKHLETAAQSRSAKPNGL